MPLFDVPAGAPDPVTVAQQQYPQQPAPQFEPVTGPAPTQKQPSLWRQILNGVVTGMKGGVKAPTPEEAAAYGAEEADPNSATNINKRLALESNARANQEADLQSQRVQQAWEELKMRQGEWEELAPIRNLYKIQLEQQVSQMPQEMQLKVQQMQAQYINALTNAGFKPSYVTADDHDTMTAMMMDLQNKGTKPEDMPIPVHDRVNNRILWFKPTDGRNVLPDDFPDIELPSGRKVRIAGLPMQTADTVISAYSSYDVAEKHSQYMARATQQAQQDADINQLAEQLIDPKNLTALKDVVSLRGDQRLKVFAAASRMAEARGEKLDPGLIVQRAKFLNQYENPTGRAALNRQSINNIMQHAGDLSDLNQEYRRSNVKILNTPINALRGQYSGIYTQYQTTMAVLKDELALYFAGGYAPTDIQKKTWDKIQSGDATPAQVEAFAKEVIHLGLRRASTFDSQFKTNMGYSDPNMITPDARAAAERLGMLDEVSKFQTGGILGPNAPAGSSTPAPGGSQQDLMNSILSRHGVQ